jgi:lipoate-protein ligase B
MLNHSQYPRALPAHRTAYLYNLPVCDYGHIWQLQKQLVGQRFAGELEHDLFLLLEHTPVLTMGRKGSLDHVLIGADLLCRQGVALYQTERGGEVTFHGPGQLVVYGICNLHSGDLTVRSFVDRLERVMLAVARDWGVTATVDCHRRGVWVGDKKLGSIGIAVKKGISYHGLALNVDMDLTPFGWISPCGLPGVEMTSLALECGSAVAMNEVRQQMARQLQQVFGLTWCGDIGGGCDETDLVASTAGA